MPRIVVVTVFPVHTAELTRVALGRDGVVIVTLAATDFAEAYVASPALVAVTEHVPARAVCKKSPLM